MLRTLALSLALVGCGGAAGPPRPAAAPRTESVAQPRLDALLAASPRPALEAALADVDRSDPLAVLVALDPLLDAGVPADDRRPALLLAAFASSDLGLPLVARCRLAELLDDATPEHRAIAFAMLGVELPGPRSTWVPLLERLRPEEREPVVAGAAPSAERAIRIAVAESASSVGGSPEALELLGHPTLAAVPEAAWMRAVLRLSTDDPGAARSDLSLVAASGTAPADFARVALALLRVRDAHAASMRVHDSPFMNGDAAQTILREVLADLEAMPLGSDARAVALEIRIVVTYWLADVEGAKALWRAMPATHRARALGAVHPIARTARFEADATTVCIGQREADELVARLIAAAEAMPADVCASLAVVPTEAFQRTGWLRIFFLDAPIGVPVLSPRETLSRVCEEASFVAESSVRLEALGPAFRESAPGHRIARDLIAHASFSIDWSRVVAAQLTSAAADDAMETARALAWDGFDPATCPP